MQIGEAAVGPPGGFQWNWSQVRPKCDSIVDPGLFGSKLVMLLKLELDFSSFWQGLGRVWGESWRALGGVGGAFGMGNPIRFS